MHLLRPLLPMLSLCAVACSETATSAVRPDPEITNLTEQVSELRGHLSNLENSLRYLACGPELRALLMQIRYECSAPHASSSTPGSSDGKMSQPSPVPVTVPTGCTSKYLQGAITKAERDLNTRSIGTTLMSLLRHEVIYLDERSDELSSLREQRLRDFLGETRLPVTRYLIVTSAAHGAPDAERRAKVVQDLMIRRGIEADRFDKPWLYSLRMAVPQLRPVDRPGLGENRDLDRAVFVFRTDC